MSQTFMGYDVVQTWGDIGIWEKFFSTYPIATLIELGTGHGGLSVFFAMQCYQRGIQYHTFDNVRCFDMDGGLAGLLNMNASFHHINIFGTEPYEMPYILNLIHTAPRPVAVLFDDGDKPREWRTFAPHLQPGDFCAVHDWSKEFKAEDIGDVRVEQILGDLCGARPYEPNGWYTMWFQRV
jgi:cephalosporin hydroxylase